MAMPPQPVSGGYSLDIKQMRIFIEFHAYHNMQSANSGLIIKNDSLGKVKPFKIINHIEHSALRTDVLAKL